MIGFRGRRFVFGAASVEDDHSPRSGALVILPLAESLLSVLGYKKYEDGSVEITMPKDGKIQELGKALNAEAKAGGISRPVFYEDQAGFWQNNEANPDLQTEPGKTYRFRIPSDSLDKNRNKQTKDYGSLRPLGAIALAEACERLQTKNEGCLYKIGGRPVWVRGATPGVALDSHVNGVGVVLAVVSRSELKIRSLVLLSATSPNDELRK
jgi:hypothetical protein